MNAEALAKVIDSPELDRVAEPLSKGVRRTYSAAGSAGAAVKDALHGVWLGHPLHPVFTDVPIGAWTTALALDLTADGDSGMERAATFALGVGLAGAAGAAVTGLTDWSETEGQARRTGLLHGLLNITATTLVAAAFLRRRGNGSHGSRALAWTGYAIALGSAYLGGDLVYSKRIGVTHAAVDEPETFTPVARSADVPEGSMLHARKEGIDVLLVRQDGRLRALAHPCAHMGGPLSEGTLEAGCVVCPWHGSRFALDDGHVINGPATQPQPTFEVREENGMIAVKARA
jgi:nitrite reductase/ring-hydroxylating ferredoxin subunit/uncharacterized membrane protein